MKWQKRKQELLGVIHFFTPDKSTLILLLFYVLLELSVLSWGIPNKNHPFIYHMDEWHQLQSIRAVFTQGTPNIPGAAHGPMLQFLLSGLFLIPFIIFQVITPFVLHTPFDFLSMQGKMFEILRLNTLLFGCLSIIVLSKISKNILKIRTSLVVFLFIFTPCWLMLSNYFKYDIALLFWILLSLYVILKFIKRPTGSAYIIAGIVSSLALATKISAIPLFGIYILSFFMFGFKKLKIKYLAIGVLLYITTFLLLGIPDKLIGRGEYTEFFYSNLVTTPNESYNYNLGIHYWIYLLINQFPTNFGYPLSVLFLISIFVLCFKVIKKPSHMKIELFLLISLLLFLLSLTTLKLFSSGNRSLVLLPFIVLIVGVSIKSIKLPKIIYILLMTSFIGFQTIQSFSWMHIKWSKDIREVSSEWIVNNISKKTEIGVENIPIYQMLPDVLLYENYIKKYNIDYKQKYDITVVNSTDTKLPATIVLTNSNIVKYQNKSDKKKLLLRMKNLGYKKIVSFSPNMSLYNTFGDDLGFYIPNLLPAPVDIIIYEK